MFNVYFLPNMVTHFGIPIKQFVGGTVNVSVGIVKEKRFVRMEGMVICGLGFFSQLFFCDRVIQTTQSHSFKYFVNVDHVTIPLCAIFLTNKTIIITNNDYVLSFKVRSIIDKDLLGNLRVGLLRSFVSFFW